MPKEKSNPGKWKPDPTIPQEKYTITHYWSLYYQEIAEFRNFKSKDTVYKYTAALEQISNSAIDEIPAQVIDAYDIWESVRSVRYYSDGKNKGKPYSASTINKRLCAIHDIFLYLEARGICADPIWLPPWKLYFQDREPDYSLMPEEIEAGLYKRYKKLCSKGGLENLRFLLRKTEQKLVRRIVKNIGKTPEPWFALAVALYEPIRLGEICGLLLSDFTSFQAPERADRAYIMLGRAVDRVSNAVKNEMKTPYSVRYIPEPIELNTLRRRYEEDLRSKGIGQTEEQWVACKGSPDVRCSAVYLSTFIKRQLIAALDQDKLEMMALAAYVDGDWGSGGEEIAEDTDVAVWSAERSLQARMLRRNAFTKYTAETPLDADSELRPISGHKSDREYPYVFAEDELWRILTKMDHRMILPALHGESWFRHIDEKNTKAYATDVALLEFDVAPDLLKKGGQIVITVASSMPGDTLTVEFQKQLPKGSNIQIEKDFRDEESTKRRRIITDSVHWRLPDWRKD